MKLLFWIIGLPLLLVAATFAVANRDHVTVSLWPLSEPIEAQLWIVIAIPLYGGFILGALVAWASGHGTRARARTAARRVEVLQRDNANLQSQLDRLTTRDKPAPTVVESRPLEGSAATPPGFLP